MHIVVYTATKCPFAFAKANLHEKLYLCIPYRRHSECVELGIFHHLLFTFANLRCDIKILCTTLQVDSMNPNECFNCPLNWKEILRSLGVQSGSEVLSKNGMFYRDISFQEGQKTKSQKSSQTGICLFANIYQSICHYVNILGFWFDTHKQAYCNISMKILQYACLQISKVKHACLIILFCFLLL